MHQTRRFFLLAAVATALAADHVTAAAPGFRPAGVAVAARDWANRLVVRMRRVVPAVRLATSCRDERSMPTEQFLPPDVPVVCPVEYSPFQYRLPPPLA